MAIWKRIVESSEVRIMLQLHEKGETRYSRLREMLGSRATLDWALRELLSDGLIKRRVEVENPPFKSFYSLTPRGQEAVKHVRELIKVVSSPSGPSKRKD